MTVRRDRDGELLLEEEEEWMPPQPHRCTSGWLGFDTEDRPIPCLVCRPHLHPSRLRRVLHW